jgi:hypothetical protein
MAFILYKVKISSIIILSGVKSRQFCNVDNSNAGFLDIFCLYINILTVIIITIDVIEIIHDSINDFEKLR